MNHVEINSVHQKSQEQQSRRNPSFASHTVSINEKEPQRRKFVQVHKSSTNVIDPQLSNNSSASEIPKSKESPESRKEVFLNLKKTTKQKDKRLSLSHYEVKMVDTEKADSPQHNLSAHSIQS